ncbi:CaiB/BaiF CoA transferase family protein [Ramlibacter albus]|uniref:CoA transferase n=1 Tax=Ramlibacter albus TaxID=2079448 RepID=A0A923M8H3_9BURK|nr:CaiB/BaiF CoA-transferase family protein [Ramlibacter albus]MBC5766227.1 CoA transferase [Ramlibacter albus]
MASKASGPLAGVRVLEMAGIGPGPFACMLLSDLGADVLRIDRPPAKQVQAAHRGPDTTNVTLRGRATLHADLKQTADRDRVLSLAANAHVLVEGFRPGVMERLGLGPDECLARNPALVYGRMTGWGQDGPLAHSAGHDINYIALTGALHAIGPREGKPVVPLNLIGDFGGGALYLAFGIVSALLEARASGHGQVVDAAIVDGTLSLMGMVYGRLAAGAWRDERGANLLDGGAAWYDTYETADGKYISIGAIEPQFYDDLCARMGLPAPERGGERASAEDLRALFLTRTREQWCELLEGTDACFAPVLGLTEAAAHPHNVARRNMVELGGVLQPAVAPRFSRTPGAIQSPPGVPVESGEARAQRWLDG